MKAVLILVPLALSACAHVAQPEVRLVSVSCIGPKTVIPPEPPRIKDQLTGQADSDARILAGSALRLRAWGEGLAGIIEACK